MAFAATMEWDVRTTGSDSNGGGFDPVSGTPGTDYSVQDSPQVTFTDLVIDGTTNTKCTSAGNPFTSAHVGNVINITSGTGFTVQRVQVMSVTGVTATCDKSLGTLSSTGGNGKLGGSLLTELKGIGLLANSNTLHIKAGTYTHTSSLNATLSGLANVQIIGFNSTHRDGGTKPLITTATNSTALVTNCGGATGGSIWWENISFSNTASTRAPGLQYAGADVAIFVDCVFDGFSYHVDADNTDAGYGPVYLKRCELKNATTKIIQSVRSIEAYDCYIHDNTGDGIKSGNGPSYVTAVRCIFARNTNGIYSDGVNNGYSNVQAVNCIFYSNTGAGIKIDAAAGMQMRVVAENCIFWGNSTYGINATSSVSTANQNLNSFIHTCAFGSNGANYNNMQARASDITLTVDPFTNGAGGDFSLNATAGGGAACKALGYPGTFPGGTSVGSLDVGAVQTASGGGGGGSLAANPLGGFVA